MPPRNLTLTIGPRAPEGRRWLPDALLAIVILVFYAEVIGYGYCKWNDWELVILTWKGALQEAFFGLHVRPLWYLSYVVTNSVVRSPFLDHVVNLSLFIASAFLAHRVAQVFIAARNRAFLATLAWVLLPWNAYPASWIAQRNDLLIYIFGFLAILRFYESRHFASFLLLTCAVLSKVTVAFVPLFFVWKAVSRRAFRLALCFAGVFSAYTLLALHNYLKYFSHPGELGELSHVARAVVYPLHWVEHLFLLLVPLPFYVSPLQGALYATALLGLAAAVRRKLRQPGGAPVTQDGPSSRDVLVIAVLSSVPTLVSSEIRICGFESLFWIILAVRHVEIRRRTLAAASYALLLISYAWSIQVTKPIFVAPADEASGPRHFYPNGYYEVRKEIILERLRSVVAAGRISGFRP